MKQPEIGLKISEARNQLGMTQRELSEACQVDIRTIQRIESGEVIPRMSTLRLIAEALSLDASIFNGDQQEGINLSRNALLVLLVIGVLNLMSWIVYSPILPDKNLSPIMNVLIAITYTLSSIFFYYTYYVLGKSRGVLMLRVTAIITMFSVPLFLIVTLLGSKFSFAPQLNQLLVMIMGLNSIFFGIGLMKAGNKSFDLLKVAGIFQIFLAPFFIIPVPVLSFVGCWLTIPLIILLVLVVFDLYRSVKQNVLPA